MSSKPTMALRRYPHSDTIWGATPASSRSYARTSASSTSRTQHPQRFAPMSPNFQIAALILQTISSLSIAGGLIFAAFQFHAARKAQHVANFTKLVELQMSLRRMRVEQPKLASVYSD